MPSNLENQTITLTIHNLGHNGEGIGSHEGYTVFVDGALLGEVVEARFFQCQKRFGRATLVSILKPSPSRVKPPCALFGKCGGCQIMHLDYPEQLRMKQQRVADELRKIGKITEVPVSPCIPSPSQLGYRNKIQLPVRREGDSVRLGLYARNSHDLIDVETCQIHCKLGEQVYAQVSAIIKRHQIDLRHLLIKSAISTGEALVILVTHKENHPELKSVVQEILALCPSVKGIVQNINTGNDNVILGRKYVTLSGQGFVTEILGGIHFKISAASFFQVNPEQALQLYKKALQLADLTGAETILDAYCGVGTLSLFFAKHVKKVIGVESVAEAIEDAKGNAALNQIGNCSFVCAKAEEFVHSLSNIDLVLLNPPRKGCEQEFLKGVAALASKKLLYISCDPATLARDLAILKESGYQISVVQPFDMFPQTSHVESLVLLHLP